MPAERAGAPRTTRSDTPQCRGNSWCSGVSMEVETMNETENGMADESAGQAARVTDVDVQLALEFIQTYDQEQGIDPGDERYCRLTVGALRLLGNRVFVCRVRGVISPGGRKRSRHPRARVRASPRIRTQGW